MKFCSYRGSNVLFYLVMVKQKCFKNGIYTYRRLWYANMAIDVIQQITKCKDFWAA